MLKKAKQIFKNNKPRYNALVIVISILVSGTYFFDRIIWAITSAYLRRHYDSHFLTKGNSKVDLVSLSYWTLFLQSYYLVVYHLLFLTAVLLAFYNQKIRPYKREVFYAYIIIAVCFIGYFAVNRFVEVFNDVKP